MELPSELISQFVKATNDRTETRKEITEYGVVVIENDRTFVRLDGAEVLTPVATTVEVVDGDRVSVMFKNHTATITGNLTSPSARIDTIRLIVEDVTGLQQIIPDLVHQDLFNTQIERIDTLEEQMKTVDLSAIEEINAKITANQNAIDNLNNVVIPELRGLITDLTDRVAKLEGN